VKKKEAAAMTKDDFAPRPDGGGMTNDQKRKLESQGDKEFGGVEQTKRTLSALILGSSHQGGIRSPVYECTP